MSSTKDVYELQKENSGDEQGAWKDGAPDGSPMIHTSLRTFDQQPEESISFKLWDLNMQVLGGQNFPTSGVVNAKWRA